MGKDKCSKCGEEINYRSQVSQYYTDDDKPICEECWNKGE